MDAGALSSGLLTGLREGVEAALIVSIICAYLAGPAIARHFPKIFPGAAAAVGLSAVIGVALFVTVGGFEEPYEQLFEGATMLLAAGVVTWMLFWMRRQARTVKGELQAAVDRVLTEGRAWGLAVLAFTAVIREGVETSLFLVGQAAAAEGSGAGSVAARCAHRPGDRRCARRWLLPGRGGSTRHVLPTDRHRARLHRRGPARPRRARVHRDRLDHRRHRHACSI